MGRDMAHASVIQLNSAAVQAEPFYTFASLPTEVEDGTTTWVQVMKSGAFSDPRYGEFDIDASLMDSMVANFDRLSRAVPFDYDHSFAKSGDSRAAGWIRSLQRRGSAKAATLWAEVMFTRAAVDAVKSGEYRYVSPEFTRNYVDETGTEQGPALLAVGLTNRPFLEGMAEVALSTGGAVYLHTKEIPTVDPKQLAQMLGLPADTPESVILAKAAEFKQLAERAPAADQVVLSAEDHRILLDAKAKADADAQAARVALRDAQLDGWIKDGKLMPAQREVIALAYDADADKVVAQFTAMQAHPGFQPAGGEGDPLPGTDADDAGLTHSQLLHKTAERLRTQDPTLTYAMALTRAAEVVGESRPHVLQALSGRA